MTIDLPAEPTTGTLQLQAQAQREVEAESARVRVTITGQSYVFGNEALAKAAEVRDFVADLRAQGFDDASIEVLDAQMELSGGKLARSSRASYTLQITCRPPARLAAALGCVANAKTAELGQTVWHYGDLKPLRDELSAACVEDVRRRAERIADGLGVPIAGVAKYVEQFAAPGEEALDFGVGGSGEMMKMAKRSAAPLDLGVAMTHRGRASFSIDVTFRTNRRAKPGGE